MEQEQGGGRGDGQDMYKVTERCLDELRCHLDNQDYEEKEDCNEEDGAGDGDYGVGHRRGDLQTYTATDYCLDELRCHCNGDDELG